MFAQVHLILFVGDQVASTTFYAAVLGAEPRLNVPGMTEFTLPGGAVLGLMPIAGAQRLVPQAFVDAPSAAPRCELYLLVDDPDGCHRAALGAGAREISPLQRRDWGHEAAYSVDRDGHLIAFARAVDA